MVDNNKVNFSSFGNSYQQNLLNLIIKDRNFSSQIKEVLKYSYFELRGLQIICKKTFEFIDKYKSHPTINNLRTILKTELSGENEQTKKQTLELFEEVVKIDKVGNSEYIQKTSVDFCKKEVLRSAMIKSVDLMNNCSFEEIEKVINTALKLGLDQNIGYDFVRDFDERYVELRRNPISSGLEDFDKIIQGGFGVGELTIIIGSSGTGKSHLLVFFSSQALKMNKTVVYYTFELSKYEVGKRHDACISGIDINELKNQKELVHSLIKDIGGRLIIKEFPIKSVSILGIRNHLEKLKQREIYPDMIVVDYLDLLKTTSEYKEKRWDLEGISEELRALAQFYSCSLLTATQSNRTGSNAELITMAEISESFAKVFVADLVMTLTRTREDREMNLGKLYITKNRTGKDGIVYPCFFNPSNVQIKILKECEIENKVKLTDKEKKEKASKSYEKYLKEK